METGINLSGESKAGERELIKNISILKSHISSKAIHDTRVNIKKLRAYCDLLNELDEYTPGLDLFQTKLLFDLLGRHREWDTVLKYMQKAPGEISDLCHLFVAHICQAKEQLSHFIKDAVTEFNGNEIKEMNEKLEGLIKVMTLHTVAGNSKKIIMQHVVNLKKLSIRFKEQPHHYRKSLKIIFYWINLFPPETLYSKKQVKQLDSFLDKMGNWHDLAIVLQKIKNYRKDYLAKSLNEYKILKKLEDDAIARCKQLFHNLKPGEIADELKNFRT